MAEPGLLLAGFSHIFAMAKGVTPKQTIMSQTYSSNISDVVFLYTAATSCGEVIMHSFCPATVIMNGSQAF